MDRVNPVRERMFCGPSMLEVEDCRDKKCEYSDGKKGAQVVLEDIYSCPASGH